jgi:hypothetical protein
MRNVISSLAWLRRFTQEFGPCLVVAILVPGGTLLVLGFLLRRFRVWPNDYWWPQARQRAMEVICDTKPGIERRAR